MKTKKTKEAVSLIVLVLTIVIMIILAGVIVINLNNSGIIDRAKNAVSETNLKNMQELANVAWGEAYLSIEGEKTSKNLKSTMLEKLKGKGVSEEELAKYTFTVTTGGVEVAVNTGNGEDTPDEGGTETPEPEEPEINVALNPSGIIPEGAVYYVSAMSEKRGDNYTHYFEPDDYATATYNAGDAFPTTTAVGDAYTYNDYLYVFGMQNYDYEYGEGGWDDVVDDGWGVLYVGTSTEPQAILESINGKLVTSLRQTFAGQNITSAPSIPATIDDMAWTFIDCYSLTGEIIINANPTDCDQCFAGCDMSKITLTGTSTMLDELAASAEL